MELIEAVVLIASVVAGGAACLSIHLSVRSIGK